MDSTKPLSIAVIGYGYWSPKLIRNVGATRGLRLVAICEKDADRHAHIREEHPGVPVFQRYEDVFARADIEAVIIATIPSSHFRIAKQALESEKHVLVEKPLALSVRDGETLLRVAIENKRTLMVDHTYLYSNAIRTVAETVRSGRLGKIFAIESIRANLGIFQRDTNVVWDLAPHDVSILLSAFAEKPTHVSAVGSTTVVSPKQTRPQESVAHLMLYYEAGFVAHIHVSWISPVKVRSLTVVGSDATIQYDQLSDVPLRLFDQGVYPVHEGESGSLFEYKTGATEDIEVPKGGEDLATMLRDFEHATRTGETPVSSARLGLDVVRILSAAQASLRGGGTKVRISYAATPAFFLTLREKYIRFRHNY
jgi:predicted dehydrogenase